MMYNYVFYHLWRAKKEEFLNDVNKDLIFIRASSMKNQGV